MFKQSLLIVSLIFQLCNKAHGATTCSGQLPKHHLGCVVICFYDQEKEEAHWFENCGSDGQVGAVARDVCGAKPPIKGINCDYTCLNGAWVLNFCD